MNRSPSFVSVCCEPTNLGGVIAAAAYVNPRRVNVRAPLQALLCEVCEVCEVCDSCESCSDTLTA